MGRERVKRTIGFVGIVTVGVMLGAVLCVHSAEYQRTGNDEIPVNFVAVSERIHTSGQPSQAQLGELKTRGYAFIINLATPASSGSIPEEGMLVAKAGLSYLNIPVDFKRPAYEDFELFSNILRQSGSRRVLIHCAVNKRASVFAFLYSVVHEGVVPDRAWENVTSVWVPEPQWKDFIHMVLKRHGVIYDPF
jgi:protein tyrosine phosphatase (PTP) superfamily phosphohydrolase (DUF442 family)